jgi:plasmid stabilization system protein ParE
MDERFSQAASTLMDHPRSGRQGIVPGTLELMPHEHHRLVYEMEDDTAWILALVHTSRQWPPVRK